jgi:hypothetical protein
MRTASFPEMT